MIKKFTCLLLFFCPAIGRLLAQAPLIQSATPLSTVVDQYGKFEVQLALSATYNNPYDYDEIRVEATFTAPDGSSRQVDGFYMEDFQITNPATGGLSALPTKGFRVRFSPTQTGTWTYTLQCTNAAGTGSFPAQSFQCVAPGQAENKGFVHAGPTNYLYFDNQEQYIPVGENMAWQNNNPYVDYKKWVDKLSDKGGNFFRLWLCHWGMSLEWKLNVSGFSGLKKYKQSSAFYLDWLFDYCANKGVYVMMCINHHGQVSSQVNPNWSDNPYNSANGGPCQNTWDFFSNTQAKALHKNRLRYILARWGYQRSIMTWELFNEVNWTDNYEQHKTAIADWHAEMAAFLKTKDPAARPVSTSYGNPQSEDPALWNNPDMDYTQRHYYFDSPNLEAVLGAGVKENLQLYDKPALIGEFGLGGSSSGLLTLDPTGIHLHNNLWGPLFSGSLGSGMTWWWDSYVEPGNLYHQFQGLSEVSRQMPFLEKNMKPVSVALGGPAGDLKLNTVLDWSALADTTIQISSNGTVSPATYKLSQYLYGASWNTQYRRPPVFTVEMPQSGLFKVKTGNQFGTSPKLIIRVDGVQVLNLTPALNQEYSVPLSAGTHVVRVDNQGTDWMKIAGYAFEGIGSAADAYVLLGEDQKTMAGWILNTDYNHVYVSANGAPDVLQGVQMQAGGMADGAYAIKWFDCLSGAFLSGDAVSVQNGQFLLEVPDFTWDMAFLIDGQPVSAMEAIAALPMEVYPNPVMSGGAQQVRLEAPNGGEALLEWCDASGKPLAQWQQTIGGNGEQSIGIKVPENLPAGVYWLRVSANGRRAAKPVSVIAP
jgi:hypothetical protein